MPSHPEPLTLPEYSADATVRSLVADRFGPGSTMIGVTAPAGHHPGIHRAELSAPGMTSCGMVSHGTPRPITQVLAVTDNSDAEKVIALLRTAGVALCRMCRRCWTGARIPSHDRRRCFLIPR
jgi:hypothetical protein